ncbi:kinase-like domain-containing protein [Haematococcus lacustris]
MANAGQPIIALAPNTLLNNGRYRIERELNRGGTAVVYAAEDTTTQQYVALKVMNGPDQVPVKVVKREIAFSAAARHDNIVRLLDVFAEKAQLIIVWELISGPDLLDLLNEHEGRMPEPMAAFFFCQLLQAVMFMHNNGFCHRDIKPENCMVQRASHQLKLIDFGLSKHLESARTLGVGTPDYLSPEMLQVWTNYTGTPVPYDARAVDAWAMGVLMFLLITGKYPFEDPGHPNNLAHTIHNVLAGRMCPFPDHMSAGCRELISGLLRIDPRQRTTLQATTHPHTPHSYLLPTCVSQKKKCLVDSHAITLAHQSTHTNTAAVTPLQQLSCHTHSFSFSRLCRAWLLTHGSCSKLALMHRQWVGWICWSL